jgi:hypothetical protein
VLPVCGWSSAIARRPASPPVSTREMSFAIAARSPSTTRATSRSGSELEVLSALRSRAGRR